MRVARMKETDELNDERTKRKRKREKDEEGERIWSFFTLYVNAVREVRGA